MTYSFQPRGICAQEMQVELDDQGIIQDLKIRGGCDGNHKGLSALVRGLPAQTAVEKLRGIQCGPRDTSCPDQLAVGLETILKQRG